LGDLAHTRGDLCPFFHPGAGHRKVTVPSASRSLCRTAGKFEIVTMSPLWAQNLPRLLWRSRVAQRSGVCSNETATDQFYDWYGVRLGAQRSGAVDELVVLAWATFQCILNGIVEHDRP